MKLTQITWERHEDSEIETATGPMRYVDWLEVERARLSAPTNGHWWGLTVEPHGDGRVALWGKPTVTNPLFKKAAKAEVKNG